MCPEVTLQGGRHARPQPGREGERTQSIEPTGPGPAPSFLVHLIAVESLLPVGHWTKYLEPQERAGHLPPGYRAPAVPCAPAPPHTLLATPGDRAVVSSEHQNRLREGRSSSPALQKAGHRTWSRGELRSAQGQSRSQGLSGHPGSWQEPQQVLELRIWLTTEAQGVALCPREARVSSSVPPDFPSTPCQLGRALGGQPAEAWGQPGPPRLHWREACPPHRTSCWRV